MGKKKDDPKEPKYGVSFPEASRQVTCGTCGQTYQSNLGHACSR